MYIMHSSCGIIDPNSVYIKDKNDRYRQLCKTNYLKQF